MNTEQMRDCCLSLPGVTEEVKWEEHLAFCIGGKMFCLTGFTDTSNVSLKVSDENFIALTERAGITPAPYLGRNKWIAVHNRGSLKPKEWKELLQASYEIIRSKLPRKLIAAIEAEHNANKKR